MYTCLHVKYALFFSDIWWKLNFPDTLSKNAQQISWKSVQWQPSCSMRADGRTDMTNLTVAFRNFLLTLLKISVDFFYSKLHSKFGLCNAEVMCSLQGDRIFWYYWHDFWLRSVMSRYIRIVRSLATDLMTRLWFPSVVETLLLQLPCAQGGCGTHWTPIENMLLSLWWFTWRQ
jgi:hypothetical protein